ncbi:DUF4184 family protein [Frankia sp. CNm7]|uniref:DUF4184 family protein n=1 Tax=Frankia nepalensis TaxID=1836974 RepID=A0A937RPQ8_9ACTN|nr:DUF4184 family protein [Frankia nepalensis]MBL7495934.1 DUF4184 family protein [Frankia nepalensis]MBL7513593.1 DUF4184 family protein [Frankia nepalensis]MBL7524025.1 DUF4184 family protein [Frankia nepalensis]MBL7632659.1 DUF4184 family protein [Frankia nepalensis]
MPFTLSHPMAVLPLRRLGLPMSALVAGSLAPDAPLFLGWPDYRLTHSVLGAVTIVPVLALAGLGFWFYLLRDALVDLAPDPVRSRLVSRARLTGRQWLLAPAAASVGAMTHIGWDAFTHSGRWGVRQVPWLSAEYGVLPGYRWAQYVSSVVGMAVVAAAIIAHLRALTRGPRRPRRHRLEPVVLPAVVVLAVGIGAVVGLANVGHGPLYVAFRGVIAGGEVLAVALLLVTAGWRVARRGPAVETL